MSVRVRNPVCQPKGCMCRDSQMIHYMLLDVGAGMKRNHIWPICCGKFDHDVQKCEHVRYFSVDDRRPW